MGWKKSLTQSRKDAKNTSEGTSRSSCGRAAPPAFLPALLALICARTPSFPKIHISSGLASLLFPHKPPAL